MDHLGFDREAYRHRNVVERFFGRQKEFHRNFSRFEKIAVNDIDMIHATFIRLYLSELPT